MPSAAGGLAILAVTVLPVSGLMHISTFVAVVANRSCQAVRRKLEWNLMLGNVQVHWSLSKAAAMMPLYFTSAMRLQSIIPPKPAYSWDVESRDPTSQGMKKSKSKRMRGGRGPKSVCMFNDSLQGRPAWLRLSGRVHSGSTASRTNAMLRSRSHDESNERHLKLITSWTKTT